MIRLSEIAIKIKELFAFNQVDEIKEFLIRTGIKSDKYQIS